MTNAGKTFTIMGSDDNPGILPRTLTAIFKEIERLPTTTSSSGSSTGVAGRDNMVVLVSFLEIYNDSVYDLLAASATTSTTTATTAAAGGAAAAASAGAGGTMGRGGVAAAAAAAAAARVPLDLRDR